VLALSPQEARANALAVLLRVARGERVDDEALALAVRSNPHWPLAPLAAAGVGALDRAHDYANALPLLLGASAAAPITHVTEDALRALALAAYRAGDTARAAAFADRYAQSCRALHRPATPLLWPLRAAGSSLRVGAIVAGDSARDAMARLETIGQRLESRWTCTVFVVAAVDADALSSGALDVRALPSDADAAARGIAALDLDVLLDFAGLQAPLGQLLARHPARAIFLVDDGRAPIASGLADRVVRAATDAADPIAEALVALHADVAVQPAAPMTVGDLAALWDQSVHAHRRGDAQAAATGYAKFLAAQPDSPSALFLRSELARANGDIPRAREDLCAAVRAAPGFVDAVVALANLETAAGHAPEALAVARRGLEHAPSAAALWRALGQAALARADGQTAAEAFAEAAMRDPTHGETHYNHGVALQMAGTPNEAARAYQRALAFKPDLHDADFNLGVIFDQKGNAGAAIAAFSNVLKRVPSHARAYKSLAETLLASGRIDAWFANFERFERHCPNHLALAVHALEVCAYRADFVRLERYIDGLRAGRFTDGAPDEMQDALEQLLYLLHFFDVEPALIGRYARTHDALARRMHGEPRPKRAPRRPGKPRIGYLSGDFRNHVMGKMMWHALRHHDRDAFEVFGYTTTNVLDEWTARYEAIFDRLTSIAARSDADAADRIAEDDLDVLVDLSTHTKGSRPGVLARKPARVQITHVASAGTLGLSAIDYKLTDAWADVAFDPDAQIEPLLVMKGCVYPYRHVAPASKHLFSRAQAGIPAAQAVAALPGAVARRAAAPAGCRAGVFAGAVFVSHRLPAHLRGRRHRVAAHRVRPARSRRRGESGALPHDRLRARSTPIRRSQRHARGARHGGAGGDAGRPPSRGADFILDSRESRHHRHGRDHRRRVRRRRRAPRDRSGVCKRPARAHPRRARAFGADRHATACAQSRGCLLACARRACARRRRWAFLTTPGPPRRATHGRSTRWRSNRSATATAARRSRISSAQSRSRVRSRVHISCSASCMGKAATRHARPPRSPASLRSSQVMRARTTT
jgi:predicted O-linked N-acetylglucosamine transferase (SPINDLY family)